MPNQASTPGTIRRPSVLFVCLCWLTLFFAATTAVAQGPIITGVGPVNRSMGGAGTAAPLESLGALHWNPGSISGLSQSEVSFGLELITPVVDLSTTVGGSEVTTRSDGGFVPIPSVGWVHHVDDSPLTVGLGVYGVAGFKNNLPMDAASPLLATGPAFASAEFLQIAPTFAYALTEKLSVGVAPTVTLGTLNFDPLGPSVITPTPAAGSGNRTHWGGGFQIGAYYIANSSWRYGFSYKSPQWFEEFRFFSENGTVRFDLDYPSIISLGTAFSGLERWTIAADARLIDFENTDGFRDLGFSSVFAFAIGAQYEASDRLHLRVGYNVNGAPIHDDDVFTNVFTPLIPDQNVTTGFSWRFSNNVDINLAYAHMVRNEVEGPLPSPPFGPDDTIKHTLQGHSAIMGMTVRY